MILGIETGGSVYRCASVYADEQTALETLNDWEKHKALVDGLEIAVPFEGPVKPLHK